MIGKAVRGGSVGRPGGRGGATAAGPTGEEGRGGHRQLPPRYDRPPGWASPEGVPARWNLWRRPTGTKVQSGRHAARSEEHTSELQSHLNLVCRLLLENK